MLPPRYNDIKELCVTIMQRLQVKAARPRPEKRAAPHDADGAGGAGALAGARIASEKARCESEATPTRREPSKRARKAASYAGMDGDP